SAESMPSSLVTRALHRGTNSVLLLISCACRSASRDGGLHGVPDDVGQPPTQTMDPTLRGGPRPPAENGADQLFDGVKLTLIGKRGTDVMEQGRDHPRGGRRPAIRRDEIAVES